MLTDADFDIFIHHPLLGKMYPLFWKARTAKYGVNSNYYGKPQNMKVQRCMTCLNCRVADCTMCLSCKDKPRFGGPGLRKKACLQRPRCLNPIMIEDFRKEHVQNIKTDAELRIERVLSAHSRTVRFCGVTNRKPRSLYITH